MRSGTIAGRRAGADTIYHLYVNSAGVIWDRQVDLKQWREDESWNGHYKAACLGSDQFWTMELVLPFKTFALTSPPPEIRVNIRRKDLTGPKENSALLIPSWSVDVESLALVRFASNKKP